MSGYTQSENVNRGSETMVDRYCNSLNILKEKVMSLLEQYHSIIMQKMECDLGNLLSYDADGFQSHLADVFSQMNDVEVHLNNLEAWAGLPPECFTSASLNYGIPDPDQVSHEAQTLVEAIRHLQAELRAMTTKSQTNSALVTGNVPLVPPAEKSDNNQDCTTSSILNTVAKQSPLPLTAIKSEITPYSIQSNPCISPSAGDPNQGYVDTLPQIPSFPSNEEGRSCHHTSSRPYSSNTNTATRSPNIDRRQQSTISTDVYRVTSGHHSSFPSPIPPQQYVSGQYNQVPPSSVETVSSNRMASETTSSKYASSNQKHWNKLGVNPDQKPGCSTTYCEVETGVRSLIRVPNHRIAGKTSGSSSEAYVQPKPLNIRYNPRMYDGGLLPRLNFTDRQVVLPEHKPRDFWSPHRAHFGQNDYIDILGDGKIKPRDFYTGPPWVLGARNEYQRVCSRLNNPAIVAWMEEFEPSKLTAEYKLQRYLFKKVNKRKNIKFERYRDSP
ncbi:unnamed protein product [Schistosoma margrebowiei]|uniref:Large ribosomal subunit protein mL51 n=1 Tax=Schistosoma margrebowiei TaxID=48269 RepID=A0A183LCE8_9TREM|nr:unnamed protein product [Schistosoma margrebowiei]